MRRAKSTKLPVKWCRHISDSNACDFQFPVLAGLRHTEVVAPVLMAGPYSGADELFEQLLGVLADLRRGYLMSDNRR